MALVLGHKDLAQALPMNECIEAMAAVLAANARGETHQPLRSCPLPPASSRILTRELLYTAVTRARQELILVGTEDTVRSAVARPVARASGLRERLWGREAT